MSPQLKSSVWKLLRGIPFARGLLAARALSASGYLKEVGWLASFYSGTAVDAAGHALPWYTYPAIRFLRERLHQPLDVFEYGSGNSTLWWADRARRVVSCEHDIRWHAMMRGRLPAHVDYYLRELTPDNHYASSIREHPGGFDVVVIDGRDRVNCARYALPALRESGVIIWDNTERTEYKPGFDLLAEHGYRRLDFWGMGPINNYGWCTSVFYRHGNCLGI
jgi:hypothetical protein